MCGETLPYRNGSLCGLGRKGEAFPHIKRQSRGQMGAMICYRRRLSIVRGLNLFFEQLILNRIEAEDFADARKTAAMNWRGASVRPIPISKFCI